MQPDSYEQRVWQEIRAWETEGPSLATRLSRWAAKPAEFATNVLVPKQLQEIAGDSLGALLTHTNNAVHRTIRPDRLLERLAKRGLLLDSHEILRSHHLPLSDDLAIEASRAHIAITTLSGAATGLGGIGFLAADIPALFATNLRLVQSIALGYGYDLEDPEERHFALHIFRVASGDPRTRIGLVQELAVVRGALTRSALGEIAGASGIGAGLQGLRRLAQRIGIEIAEKKMLALIPVLGIGIGAGFNYLFTQEVARAATMGYRKRWLMDKYPDHFRVSPTGRGETIEGTIVDG